MRVAVVHPYPWPEVRRGAERYLDDLTHYLAGRAHDVHVVTGTHDTPGPARRDDGATVHRVRHLRPGRLDRAGLGEVETFGARAARELLRLRPDVVHAFTPSGALAGSATRRPTLYTILGHPDVRQLPAERAPRWLLRAAVRKASVVAALSQASADALRATFARDPVVLPPGVRLERFVPDLEPRAGAPRLLFSATLADRRKRADLAVSTFALVLSRHPDARLALSGEGDPSWVLETASRLGDHVRAAVDVLGPGDPAEVPARYRSATLTILPAEHEAFGLALVESLASGTPVVCTPSGGMPEVVGTCPVGRAAAAPTPAALADAVEAVLELAGRRATPARCVERARRWAWEDSVGPQHERHYGALAAARATRREGTS